MMESANAAMAAQVMQMKKQQSAKVIVNKE